MEILQFLILPFLAGLILTGIHAYLGVHVVERGVIFVDLSLAQIAALGSTIAVMRGFDVHGQVAYFWSLGFTIVGAAIFSLTRVHRETRVPQVFSYLIVPSVAAMLFARRIGTRLAIGWTMGAVVTALGVMLSFKLDLPTGATIVCTFGASLALLAAVWAIRRPRVETEPA